jgi:hypothetical protein
MSKNSAFLLRVQFAYCKDKGKPRNKKLFSLVVYRVSINDKKNIMFQMPLGPICPSLYYSNKK